MANSYTRTTETIDTNWTLVEILRDNWGWIVSFLGLSSLNSWLIILWENAKVAPWYQKGVFIIFGSLLILFLISGIRGFLIWYKRSQREEGAIAIGLSWSGHTYANGSMINGGTHRLVEIFGTDQIRSNLTFKNCQILGPGIVCYFNCHIEKSEFFGLPKVQYIKYDTGNDIPTVSMQLMNCRFENCVFSNMLHIGTLSLSGPDVRTYRIE